MRRGVITLDRAVGTLISLVLIAAGTLALCWYYNVFPTAPTELTSRTPADYSHSTWWPWATGAAAIAVLLLGLFWLTRHLPRRTNSRFTLPSTITNGRLLADANAAATAAAEGLAARPEFRDGSGRIRADRGQLVAELHCTIEPAANLDAVHAAVTQATQDLHAVLGIPALHHRTHLRVARTNKPSPTSRVR
ncbi:hypothetical protein [Kribbella solani]|uniref:hypothetical protein n=1 Tax=Kribbella solani TaxID=236067 RepID=UPI0029BB2791|nr:hypothetical protein [Kribbella solani]MDX2967883.1 hypothetical protein [Kribbella solani]